MLSRAPLCGNGGPQGLGATTATRGPIVSFLALLLAFTLPCWANGTPTYTPTPSRTRTPTSTATQEGGAVQCAQGDGRRGSTSVASSTTSQRVPIPVMIGTQRVRVRVLGRKQDRNAPATATLTGVQLIKLSFRGDRGIQGLTASLHTQSGAKVILAQDVSTVSNFVARWNFADVNTQVPPSNIAANSLTSGNFKPVDRLQTLVGQALGPQWYLELAFLDRTGRAGRDVLATLAWSADIGWACERQAPSTPSPRAGAAAIGNGSSSESSDSDSSLQESWVVLVVSLVAGCLCCCSILSSLAVIALLWQRRKQKKQYPISQFVSPTAGISSPSPTPFVLLGDQSASLPRNRNYSFASETLAIPVGGSPRTSSPLATSLPPSPPPIMVAPMASGCPVALRTGSPMSVGGINSFPVHSGTRTRVVDLIHTQTTFPTHPPCPPCGDSPLASLGPRRRPCTPPVPPPALGFDMMGSPIVTAAAARLAAAQGINLQSPNRAPFQPQDTCWCDAPNPSPLTHHTHPILQQNPGPNSGFGAYSPPHPPPLPVRPRSSPPPPAAPAPLIVPRQTSLFSLPSPLRTRTPSPPSSLISIDHNPHGTTTRLTTHQHHPSPYSQGPTRMTQSPAPIPPAHPATTRSRTVVLPGNHFHPATPPPVPIRAHSPVTSVGGTVVGLGGTTTTTTTTTHLPHLSPKTSLGSPQGSLFPYGPPPFSHSRLADTRNDNNNNERNRDSRAGTAPFSPAKNGRSSSLPAPAASLRYQLPSQYKPTVPQPGWAGSSKGGGAVSSGGPEVKSISRLSFVGGEPSSPASTWNRERAGWRGSLPTASSSTMSPRHRPLSPTSTSFSPNTIIESAVQAHSPRSRRSDGPANLPPPRPLPRLDADSDK